MTVHAAKGLEWDLVAVPGLVDEVFPTEQVPVELGHRRAGPAVRVPRRRRRPAAARGYTTPGLRGVQRRVPLRLPRRGAAARLRRHDPGAPPADPLGVRLERDPEEACTVSPFLAEVSALGDAAVTSDEWADDPEPDAAQPAARRRRRRRPVAGAPRARRSGSGGGRSRRWSRPARRRAERRRPRARRRCGPTASGWRRDTEPAAGRDPPPAVARRRRRGPGAADDQPGRRDGRGSRRASPHRSRARCRRRPVAQARRGSRFHQWVEQLYGVSPLLEPDDLPGAEDADLDDAELAIAAGEVPAPTAGRSGSRSRSRRRSRWWSVAGCSAVGSTRSTPTDDGGYDVIDYKTGAVLTGKDFEAASHQLSIYRLAWADLPASTRQSSRAGFLYVRDRRAEAARAPARPR